MTKSSEEVDITLDYGDALLKARKVSQEMYDVLQEQAKSLILEHN